MRVLYTGFLLYALASTPLGAQTVPPKTSSLIVATNRQDSYVPTLTFDVASIHENNSPLPYSLSRDNPTHSSLFQVTNFTARDLIMIAYGVSNFTVSGGASWIGSTRFDIRAKADSSVDDALAKLSDREAAQEKQHMIQLLLKERFNLKVHQEVKPRVAYELSVGKGGAKFAAATSKPDEMDDPHNGEVVSKNDSRSFGLVGHAAPIKALCDSLADPLRGPVADKTGLADKYNFTLRYGGIWDTQPNSQWPILITAIREQLGLDIRTIKLPSSILVVDSIDKPSQE
jgi:uncharacterized protein (TIGR03435 family)